jgi:hypothetical protein
MFIREIAFKTPRRSRAGANPGTFEDTPAAPSHVCLSRNAGSGRPTAKMTRLTHSGQSYGNQASHQTGGG